MNDCHLMVASHLMPLLSQLFDNAAPVLLEFAEKAQSNTSQQRFFEAMRGIHDHRSAMENAFIQELQRQFRESALARPHEGRAGQGSAQDSFELALVNEEAFEETLALQNTVTKAQLNYSHEIYGLRQRLALVFGGRKLEDDEIPGGPHQLAECFRISARALPLEPKAKLIVFVLFDKFVTSQLGDMYREYNSQLVLAGLLPHLKYDIPSNPAAAASAASGVEDPAGDDQAAPPAIREPAGNGEERTVGEEAFDAICQLLSGRRQGRSPGSGAGANVVPQPVLVSAINRLQRADLDSTGGPHAGELVPTLQVDAQLIERIKSLLEEQREQLFAGVDGELAGGDADLIDLVGLIFEYMLNDDSLPNAVKALLSRLHTPFLKVAILDKQFFIKESHPARQLLNAMIDAGSRYVVERDLKHGIFPYLQSIVNRVREEFEEHLGLFGVLLVDLQTRVEQLRNIVAVTERRTREAATGQDKLERARERAAEVVDARIQGRTVPPPMVRLLQQSLVDKLMFILLRDRDGEQGSVWQTALRLMEDIIWSTAPPATEAAQRDLRAQLPGLQTRIRTSLELLAKFGADDAAPLFEQIAACQQAALSAQPRHHSQAAPTGETAPAPAPAAAAPPAAGKAQVTLALSPEEQRVNHALGRLEFGTWFDFIPGGIEPRRRLKLAWYTPVADRYMFVDSMGVKAEVLSRRDLARQMAAGKVRISVPEKRPFLDRALEAVRNLLGAGERAQARVLAV